MLHITSRYMVATGGGRFVVEVTRAGLDNPVPEDAAVVFDMRTYKKIHGDPAYAAHTFRPVNEFFAQLTDAEQAQIYDYFATARLTVITVTRDTIQPVVLDLARRLAELCYQLRLLERLHDYAQARLPPPPDDRVNPRPQDSDAMTFLRPERWVLMAISVFCKMLCPIWGELINRSRELIDDVNKELYCYVIAAPVLENGVFASVMRKYNRYQNAVIRKQLRDLGKASPQDVQFALTQTGFTAVRLEEMVLAVGVVKRFTIFDPYEPDSNIMLYLYRGILALTEQKVNRSRHRDAAQQRLERDQAGGDPEDNTSGLETHSRVSQSSADTPVAVGIAAQLALPRMLQDFAINPEEFRAAVDHYHHHPVMPSPLNLTLISSYLAHYIGGSFGLQYLNARRFAELAAIMQLHLVHLGRGTLAHLLTASNSTTRKDEALSAIDSRLINNFPNMNSLRQLEADVFCYVLRTGRKNPETGKDEELGVRAQMELVKDFIVLHHHYHNTAPSMCDLLDEDPRPQPGELIVYDETVMVQVCSLLLERHRASAV